MSLGGLADVRVGAVGELLVEPGEGTLDDDVEALRTQVASLLGPDAVEGAQALAAIEAVLVAFLDGSAARTVAAAALARDDALAADDEELRVARAEADAAARTGLPTWAPAAVKRPGWRAEQRRDALDRQRVDLAEDRLERLHAARRAAPDAVALRHRLQDLHRQLHPQDPVRHEAELRLLDDGCCAAWLRRHGRLTLVTDVPARATLHRFASVDRQLQPQFVRSLGPTPLDVELPMGSYLVVLDAPGRPPVRYPVLIERLGHWDGVPPGASDPLPVGIPTAEELPPGACYVPAGWCIVGSEAAGDRRRLWVDAFAIAEHFVSHGQFARWAWAQDDPDCLPWGDDQRPLYEGSAEAWTFRPGRQGGRHVDSAAWGMRGCDAMAFAAAAGGRLAGEYEWEKAARGVDGRAFPWGDSVDARFAWVYGRRRARIDDDDLPPLAQTPAADVSVYGVRGLGGGLRDFCLDGSEQSPDPSVLRYRPRPEEGEEPMCQVRGGCWMFHADHPSATRSASSVTGRHSFLGFRVAWPL